MKQLYATLEDKEKELRDFIRNYEQVSAGEGRRCYLESLGIDVSIDRFLLNFEGVCNIFCFLFPVFHFFLRHLRMNYRINIFIIEI